MSASDGALVRLPVYLLAGGLSARFGSDKARAPLDGEPLLLHVARAFSRRASRVTVVADSAGKYGDLGLRTIPDERPHLGPLGGLRAALADLAEHADSAWLVLAPCDTLGWDPGWIDALIGEIPDAESAGQRAIAYRDAKWEPLPALYHRALLPRCDELLVGPRAPLHGALSHDETRALPTPDGWASIGRFDTPGALLAWRSPRRC